MSLSQLRATIRLDSQSVVRWLPCCSQEKKAAPRSSSLARSPALLVALRSTSFPIFTCVSSAHSSASSSSIRQVLPITTTRSDFVLHGSAAAQCARNPLDTEADMAPYQRCWC
jgi:hypothetical protein